MCMSGNMPNNSGAKRLICWQIAATSFGKVLIAATDKGVCRIAFGENEDALRRKFPDADLQHVPAGMNSAFSQLLDQVIAALETPGGGEAIPIDVEGTPFQRECWDALRRIPVGETRSYVELAAAIGKPKAARAVGLANGANGVAVLIPCHRVIRANGALGGYAYGDAIKRELLERERRACAAN